MVFWQLNAGTSFQLKLIRQKGRVTGVPLITPLVFKQVHRLRDYSHIYSTAEEMLGVLAESLIPLFIINILTLREVQMQECEIRLSLGSAFQMDAIFMGSRSEKRG